MQVSPAGVDAETERVTVPVSPLRADTVIADVPESPARIWLEVTPGSIVKSTTWNTMLAVGCDNGSGFVPVTVTV